MEATPQQPKPIPTKRRYSIVLEALMSGQELEDGGYKISMKQDADGNWHTVCRATVTENGKRKPDKFLAYPMSLANFIAFVDKLPDDDIFIMGANVVLTDINRKKRG